MSVKTKEIIDLVGDIGEILISRVEKQQVKKALISPPWKAFVPFISPTACLPSIQAKLTNLFSLIPPSEVRFTYGDDEETKIEVRRKRSGNALMLVIKEQAKEKNAVHDLLQRFLDLSATSPQLSVIGDKLKSEVRYEVTVGFEATQNLSGDAYEVLKAMGQDLMVLPAICLLGKLSLEDLKGWILGESVNIELVDGSYRLARGEE